MSELSAESLHGKKPFIPFLLYYCLCSCCALRNMTSWRSSSSHRIGFPPLFLSYRFPRPSNRSQSSSAWLPHFFRNLRIIETSWRTGKSFKVLRWHCACLAILFPVTSPRYAESRSPWASWCHEQTPATETMRKTLPTSKLVYLVYML